MQCEAHKIHGAESNYNNLTVSLPREDLTAKTPESKCQSMARDVLLSQAGISYDRTPEKAKAYLTEHSEDLNNLLGVAQYTAHKGMFSLCHAHARVYLGK